MIETSNWMEEERQKERRAGGRCQDELIFPEHLISTSAGSGQLTVHKLSTPRLFRIYNIGRRFSPRNLGISQLFRLCD